MAVSFKILREVKATKGASEWLILLEYDKTQIKQKLLWRTKNHIEEGKEPLEAVALAWEGIIKEFHDETVNLL